ncbi:MAG TPA: beta-mannosidase [Anaerolineae bacterium]|nr:beta-mannosidase [Anaerolineae bacterium]
MTHYLFKDDRPLYLIGVNYWSRRGGPLMWRYFDADTVRGELEEMRALGMNVIRSFLYWPDFMPTPDAVDPVMLARWESFLDLCEEVGIYTIPTFFVGHMSGENWDVPWRQGRDLYHDPWMLERERFYVQEVARRGARHHAIVAWLLTNEFPLYAGETNAASGLLWARTLCNAVREVDPNHPVSPGDGAWQAMGRENGLRLDDLAEVVDFYGPHTYQYFELDALRHSHIPAALTRLIAAYGKPVLLEEFGCSTGQVSYEHQADYFRTTYHSVFVNGGCGTLGWCFSDFDGASEDDPGLIYQRPYSHHPFELYFGVTRADGTPKPAGLEIKRFAELLSRLDLTQWRLPEPQAYSIVPSYFTHDYPFFWNTNREEMAQILLEGYTLSKMAGINLGFWPEPAIKTGIPYDIEASEEPVLPEAGRLLIMPHQPALTAPTWAAIRKWVEAGGTFYYSYRHMWWTYDAERLFGIQHHLRFGVVDVPAEDIRLTFEVDFGPIRAGDVLRYRCAGDYRVSSFCPVTPTTAEVIARDGEGRPAILLNRLGSGQVVFSAYPLEYYLIRTPEVHVHYQTYRLYQALAQLAGVVAPFAVDNPFVEVGYLHNQDEKVYLVWLINHSWGPASGQLTATVPIATITDFESGEPVDLHLDLPKKQVWVLRIE